MHRKSLPLAVPSGQEQCWFVNTVGGEGHGRIMSSGFVLRGSSIKNVPFALIILPFMCHPGTLGRRFCSSYQLNINSFYLGCTASWNLPNLQAVFATAAEFWLVPGSEWEITIPSNKIQIYSQSSGVVSLIQTFFPLYSGSCWCRYLDIYMFKTVRDASELWNVISIAATGQSISISIIAFCLTMRSEMIVSTGRGSLPLHCQWRKLNLINS